jgi:serine phosphatase RsbU (regulator of sigma subunit)
MEANQEVILHKVLERQIRKLFGKGAVIPAEFADLLRVVSATYTQFDQDHALLEHTMDISAKELAETNQSLIRQKVELQVAYEQLKTTQEQLAVSEQLVAISHELETTYKQLEEQTAALKISYINQNAAKMRAKRIQDAMLPSRQKVMAKFKAGFIFYQPLDFVSGDFYWFAEVNKLKILIAADCTGHGVPGAFMTVMATAMLEEIVNSQETVSPKEILEALDFKITKALLKKGADNNTHDGMDAAILAINEEEKTVVFAGAKNPLYVFKNGNLTEIKGSIFPVGGNDFGRGKLYEDHLISYVGDESFYITSDGYQSQFSEKGEKFMRKKLKQLLTDIGGLPMDEQRRRVKFTFADWKGDAKQTDDILVIGIQL